MKRSFCLFSIFFLLITISVSAQNQQRTSSGTSRQALVIDIESRVLEQQVVVWSENNRKVSIPGVPVGIQLVGSNIIVSVQFTPYIRPDGNVMVAQAQIWIADDNNEMNYFTSIQTIPMELGENIHYFPLGTSEHLSPSIEIVLVVKSYSESGTSRAAANRGNGS